MSSSHIFKYINCHPVKRNRSSISETLPAEKIKKNSGEFSITSEEISLPFFLACNRHENLIIGGKEKELVREKAMVDRRTGNDAK